MPKNETDLSEFISASKLGGIPCWYTRIDITDEQREKLDAALEEPSISNAAIAKVLSSWGQTSCGDGAVRNHRARNCNCD